MVDSAHYIETVRKYFAFLLTEFNISEINQTINGNAFYDVQYGDKTKNISISYENIEDHFQVIVFKLKDGNLPDYDDKSQTLHLDILNQRILPKASQDDFKSNNSFFSAHSPNTELERRLLKAAKDLRLCLKLIPEL